MTHIAVAISLSLESDFSALRLETTWPIVTSLPCALPVVCSYASTDDSFLCRSHWYILFSLQSCDRTPRLFESKWKGNNSAAFFIALCLYVTSSWDYGSSKRRVILACCWVIRAFVFQPHAMRYIGYDGVRLASQNCGFYGPLFHPWVIVMWTIVWWYRLGLTPVLSTRVLWQPSVLSCGPVSRDISGASRRMDEGNEDLVYPSLSDFKRYLTCRKILRHGTSGFTSHPKEGVLLTFIALKNPSSWPCSNSRTLGPVASTLTTTPPRRLNRIP
jgi:hypothetical protein